ncbi:MAG: translation initiation factor IF-2 [Desulfamplus sp.]|nr:translation initiation factor IF-2 [Desulfamplus sp.]
MAKIRVHELAKELNLTNKAILTKLKAMSIEVKSHMSSLEDETVEYIRLNIFGNKQKDNSAKPSTSVIRRRKTNKNEIPSSHQETGQSDALSQRNAIAKLPRRDAEKAQIDIQTNSFERVEENNQDNSIKQETVYSDKNSNTKKSQKEYNSLDTGDVDNSNSSTKQDSLFNGQHKNNLIEEIESIETNNSTSKINSYMSEKDSHDHITDIYVSKSAPSQNNTTEEAIATKSDEPDLAYLEKETKDKYEEHTNQNSHGELEKIDSSDKEENQEDDDDNTTIEENENSDLEQDSLDQENNDLSSGSDRKKKKKKKQKKSEPAKIIKLAIPTPPVPIPPPPVQVPAEPSIKKRDYADKTSGVRVVSFEKDKGGQQRERAGYDKNRTFNEKNRPTSEKERIFSDKDKSSLNRDNRGEHKISERTFRPKGTTSFDREQRLPFDKEKSTNREQRVPFDKEKSTNREQRVPFDKEKSTYREQRVPFDKEKSTNREQRVPFDKEKSTNREQRVPFDKEKSTYSPSGKFGNKIDTSFVKPRGSKKDVAIDIPFVPIEPLDKDDVKSKRNKDKAKKKKWSDEEDLSDSAKLGQKKRKSVVEGKDLYEQEVLAKKLRKKDSKNKQRPKVQQKTQITVPKAIKRRIKIDDTIELSELAKRMSIKANEMIQKLMGIGVMVTVNQTIDFDTAALVAAEFDYEVEKAAVAEDMLSHANEADAPENLTSRPPVVTIMGHVDHGKTSLLDVIRKSKITTGEAGGITQHIGAYSVQTPKGGIVTFLDTPGHAAFTSMRSRGAKVTDIVVLVVAADDGVMPQTVEAINHSKAAAVPVVVAVNKMDKPNADPEKVMRELADHGLLSEEWGGDVIFAQVSAKKKQGIDELLDLILLQAEVLELKANPDRLAKGHVVEARLDAGRGPIATVLVQQGTLKTGQPVVCGLHSGKIRIMTDDMGKNIESAGPSTPVEIVGLSGVPEAGDEFIALASEKDAKNISESRMQKERAKELAKKSRANLEKLFANMGSDQAKQLKLIIKADVHGSLEAINESLIKLSQEEVDVKIVHSGTGAINESDVSLAAVSDAIIIGFNVRPTAKVREMAKEENVDMRFYDIIYNVINDIKTALTGLMPSTFHEIIIGSAEVRDIFVIPGKGTIAGCFVQDGKVARGEKIRLLRDGVIKCDSSLSSLRRFKDDAKEVTQGYECGIGIEKFNDIKVGDIIECYEVEERKASIENLKESTT